MFTFCYSYVLLLCTHSRPTTSSHVRYTAAILYIVSRGSLNYLHRKQLRWGSNTTIRLHSTPSQKFAFINKQQKISSEPDWNIAVLNVKLAPSNNFFSDGEGVWRAWVTVTSWHAPAWLYAFPFSHGQTEVLNFQPLLKGQALFFVWMAQVVDKRFKYISSGYKALVELQVRKF